MNNEAWDWKKSIFYGSPCWLYKNYRIVYYKHTDEYQAYFENEKVCRPPDSTPCKGCGNAHCRGQHKCWVTLERAILACMEHYKRRSAA